MRKRKLAAMEAMLVEWGIWARHQDSLSHLGVKSPSLMAIKPAHPPEYYMPEERLHAIHGAVNRLRDKHLAAYKILWAVYVEGAGHKMVREAMQIPASRYFPLIDMIHTYIQRRLDAQG